MLSFNRFLALAAMTAAGVIMLFIYGCESSPPPPATYTPPPSTFDRAWSAAIGAAQDEGIRITSEDRVSGTIYGDRGQQQITIFVRTQADGNVRLEFTVRGPKDADPGLTTRISRAYDRRMGR
jgi:hypothetical protein